MQTKQLIGCSLNYLVKLECLNADDAESKKRYEVMNWKRNRDHVETCVSLGE